MVDPHTVTRTRTLLADPDEVWEAITDDGLGVSIDPVPGGKVNGDDPVTGERRIGAIERVDAPNDLRFRWWPIDEPDRVSTVDITLTPTTAGTTVTVTERLVLNPDLTPRMSTRHPVMATA